MASQGHNELNSERVQIKENDIIERKKYFTAMTYIGIAWAKSVDE